MLENVSSSKAPLSDAAGIMLGSWGAILLTITVILSIAGNLASIFFVAARMTYALSIEKNLLSWFGMVSEKRKASTNSIYFLAVLALVLALTGSFVWLAIISSLARLIGFGVCMAVLIQLRIQQQKPIFERSLQMLLPAMGLTVCIWLAAQAKVQA